ncbi:hypothetical protein [Cupriavidus nantongensis]
MNPGGSGKTKGPHFRAGLSRGKKKGPHAQTFFFKSWCPGEDSVTQARPRLRLQAQPFSSSRKALKRFSSWADMKKGLHAQTFF